MALRKNKPTIAHSAYSSITDRKKAINWTPLQTLSIVLFLLCAISYGAQAEMLSGDQTWSPADGTRLIEEDLTVPADAKLTIAPGTEIVFEKGASLIIEGEIYAVGSFESPILFSSAQAGPAPGDWGNIRFVTVDTTLSYDDAGAYVKGSRLAHCIVEYGGQPHRKTAKEFIGGAIHCKKSSPYLTDLIIRNNKSQQGGGIYCHEFASPYIARSLFKDNEATESGGGIACFFYSNAVVLDNVFQANIAGEHGGGIYFSFSSPQIIGNIIENNRTGLHGGGLYCSNTVTQAISRVRGNVMLSNRSDYQANSVYITAKIETIFQENCLIAGEGYDVYIEALEKNLDFRGNYFGPPSRSDLEARIYDGYDDPAQLTVEYDPVLESPPPDLPNAPQDISYFDLLGDEGYSSDWPLPLCDGAPVYLEARAQDRNPYHADWVPVRLRSSVSDPKGIVALAWETGPSTGIFRVEGKVGSASLPRLNQIKARPGETLFFSVEGVEGFEISRPVDTPKSYITLLRLPEEADTMHVINHTPIVSWAYRDIFGNKQQRYQLQLSDGVPFSAPPYWDSAEQIGSLLQARMHGAPFSDGRTYGLRLRIFNGITWSDWTDLTMRMNSLPTLPVPSSPQNGVIVKQIRPAITMQASQDAEGDQIIYEMQLYQDPEFTRVLAIEKEASVQGNQVIWAPPTDLADDAEYYWRARSRDAYETGDWTETGQFWVNLVEEPPLPFDLLDPEIGLEVYQLEPVFSWQETFDPDPLSSVRYKVYYSRNADFTEATTLTLETEGTFIKALKALRNEAAYYWKVEAIDNTGRATVSNQVGSFYVNTTPSVPELLGPFAGEELMPSDQISWNPSTDPNPDDVIEYQVQITQGNFEQPIIDFTGPATSYVLEQIPLYAQLVDNIEYRYRVRAKDNHGITSDWSAGTGLFFFNKLNDPPGPVAMPMSPDGGVVTDPEPTLSWGAAQDADRSDPPEKLAYLIQFDQDGDFVEGVRQVQVMAGVTRVRVPGLADNQAWNYRLRAVDNDGAVSVWSAAKSFILNTKNDPPLPFGLLGPADGTETYRLTGIDFSWEAARDPDPLDSLSYWIVVAPEGQEGTPVSREKLTGTAWTLNKNLQNNTDYIWWVEAVDRAGEATRSSQSYALSINTTPSVPQVTAIAAGVITGGETLHWQPSIDPNPNDLISYDVRIINASGSEVAAANNISSVNATKGVAIASFDGLRSQEDNSAYAFQVRAKDQNGAMSAWSAGEEFLLDLVNTAPAAPSLIEPSAAVSRDTEITVTWSPADDADPSDTEETIKYNLQVVQGNDFENGQVQERAMLSGAHSLTDLQLADNQLWTLRVRAEDARGGLSAWSSAVQLLVNVSEEPPSRPEVNSPASNATIMSTDPVIFAWSTCSDPDYNAVIHYEVRWWPEGNEGARQSERIDQGTTFNLEGLDGDQDYQYQVVAIDETGLENASATRSFHIEIPNNPPEQFNLTAPENGAVELPVNVEFSWQAAVDNDPNDEVRYTLYLAKDEYFQQNSRTYDNLTQTRLNLEEPLEAGSTYYWKVVAEDRKGLRVWGSDSGQNPFRLTTAMPEQPEGETEP